MLIFSKNCRMDSDIEEKRQNAIEQVGNPGTKCIIYIQVVLFLLVLFLLTFPSAIKVFHQRDHCTFSVGNG